MLRDGLTNPQIAERMGISLDGAKYHVSEIMEKLGASSRQEAALIRLEEYRPWWAAAFAPFVWFWRKASVAAHPTPSGVATVAAAGLGIAAVGGLGLLAFLLLRDGGDGGSSDGTPTTNDLAEELGASEVARDLDQALQDADEQFFIDSVLYEDVECGTVEGPPGYPAACAGLPVGATAQGLPVSVLQSERDILRSGPVRQPGTGYVQERFAAAVRDRNTGRNLCVRPLRRLQRVRLRDCCGWSFLGRAGLAARNSGYRVCAWQ